MTREREKQSVLRARRLRRVRKVRCLRSIFCIDNFPYPMLGGREMPPIDARLVGVIPGDAKGGEQGFEFQEHRILPGTHHISKDSPCLMIDCIPQPSYARFGPDETPHFIELGGALWSGAAGA